jgi:ankyrin repeat protein
MKKIDENIFKAINENDLNEVKNAINQGANINAQLEKYEDYGNPGWTPLMAATASNTLEIVNYLLDKGADISLRNSNGSTVLDLACRRGRLKVVTLLLEKGADIHTKDNDGHTPLMAICSGKTLDTDGTEEDYLKIARLLIEQGADVNEMENKGETALHKAAFFHFDACIELLVQHGADINIQSHDGSTPMMNAISDEEIPRCLQTVKLLVAKGADITLQDREYGHTALDIACMFKNYEVITFLKQLSKKQKGCYIATVCYGSSDAPEVLILQQYRDEKLSHSLFGKMCIELYYMFSPSLARRLQHQPIVNHIIRRWLLNPIVMRVKKTY